jgi:serine/threonine protein kinase
MILTAKGGITMAKVTPVGRPANEAERDVIFYLQNNLPDSFEIYHNLELRQGKQVYEIDLIIIGPRCVFVVDVKATHGKIEVFGSKWHPEGRSPFHSPVVLVRQHAKVLATQIGDANRARPELRNVHVQATVLLTADDAFVIDHTGKDEPHITYADQRCLDYFQGHDFIPPKRLSDIRKYGGTVRKAIEDKSAPSTGLPRYRDWQVIEKLGRSPDYIEYRAHKIDLANDIVRLKVYQVNPYAPSEERQEIRNLISTAYQALRQISFHSNIEQVIDFFNTEDEDAYVLVTADLQGKSLRQYIEQGLSSLEKTWKIFQEVLSALDHAHQSGIIHRNITPDSIFIDDQTKTYLIGFDYARISGRTSTIANDITETLADDLAYQAPECHNQPSAATHQSDLFSAGLVFYELLTGQSAFQDASDLCDRSAIFPQKPSQLNPKLLLGLDQWLQKLCAFNPAIRYESADDALGKLAQIIREPSTQVDSLPEGTILDERYEVLDNLGQPGNFGIVYRVADTWEGETRVLKLIIHDHYSTHNRLLQEYLSLKPVPKHPYIVDAVWAGELKNGIPFILFEYVEGRNLEEVIKAQDLSEIKAEAIIQAILEGLQHLHQHGVYHQDIKPSNILLTEQGIKIIDFNVAVTDKEPDAPSAGTPRYIPPDLAHQQQLNQSERIDRDLYGAGLVFYECLTGCYPFQSDRPPLSQPAPDPLTIEGCHSLSPHWSSVLAKAIAPLRCYRFSTVDEFLAALTPIHLPQIAPPHPLESIQSKDSSNTSEIDAQAIDSPPLHLDETESIPALPQPVTALIQVISSDVAKDEVTDVETERPLIDSAVDYAKSETVPAVRQPSREQPIVLDPTKAYPALPSYVPITTEVEWLQKFGTSDSPYWVRGKRLCQWARDWLSAWNKLDLIEEEKTDPRISLEQYLGTSKAISSLDNSTILNLLMHLESQADDQPIAALLARETQSDRQFWLSEPSIDHLARWLSIQVPSKFSIIEHAWCQQLPRTELAEFYQPSHKLDILRQWLGLHEPRLALEKYPLSVPAVLQEEFEQFWQRRLYLSEAKDILTRQLNRVHKY